jgi:hypothetical protein
VVVGYLYLPGRLFSLVAAAAADRFGLGAALACYVSVALALVAVTAIVPTTSSSIRSSAMR